MPGSAPPSAPTACIFDAPAIISWKFPANRYGNLEIVYSPELDIVTEHYAQDDRLEITGTAGVITITRGHGRLGDQPPLMLYAGGQSRGLLLRRCRSRLAGELHPFDPPLHRGAARRAPRPGSPARRGATSCASRSPPSCRPSSAAPCASTRWTRRKRQRHAEDRMNFNTDRSATADTAPDSPAARAAAIAAAGGLDAALADGTACRPSSPCRWSRPSCSACCVRACASIWRSSATAIRRSARCCASTRRPASPAAWQFRNEIAMAHAATQLSWQYGEVAAVVTSIGPGALQAFRRARWPRPRTASASITSTATRRRTAKATTCSRCRSPSRAPSAALTAVMGRSHVLHTPESLREALRRGAATVRHPYKAGPFYLLHADQHPAGAW